MTKNNNCLCGYAFGDKEKAIVCGIHYQEDIDALNKKIESAYNANESIVEMAQLLLGKIALLEKYGDALAATGGQHGFDEALDKWNEVRYGK